MIIETTSNEFYRVWPTNQEGLDHVWFGEKVRYYKAAEAYLRSSRKVKPPVLVSKAHTLRIIEGA